MIEDKIKELILVELQHGLDLGFTDRQIAKAIYNILSDNDFLKSYPSLNVKD